MYSDDEFMRLALEQAELAFCQDEVPVGAVIVKDGKVIAAAYNKKEQKNCALYHAEMIAIKQACEKVGNWFLEGCVMYVTLEPCAMCCGAIVHSRLDGVVFGALDNKTGAIESVYKMFSDGIANHKVKFLGGVLEAECSGLVSKFFKEKRELKKAKKFAIGEN